LPDVATERLKSPRARLFVALDLPAEVREQVVAWQGRELGDPALRPVRPESLHFTLVFLGYQAEKDVGRIAEAALGGEGAAPELELLPDPVGIPRGRRPRLFALEARSPGLVELQGEVEGRLVDAGFHEAERRAYWPHLTVARVRPEHKGGRKPAAVERPPGSLTRTPVRFRPTRLVLFRSHLKRTGAEYEPMAELELPTAANTER
jgi:2'-5' RNA ligase